MKYILIIILFCSCTSEKRITEPTGGRIDKGYIMKGDTVKRQILGSQVAKRGNWYIKERRGWQRNGITGNIKLYNY